MATTRAKAYEAIECLGKLTELYQRRRAQLAAEVGLTELEWLVLEQISSEGFMPSMFAKQRESSPAAVSRVLRQLLNKSLVSTSVSEADGRQREYALTEAGLRTLGEVRLLRDRAVRSVWLDLDAQRLDVFTELGHELVARLEDYASTETTDASKTATPQIKAS